MDTVVVWRMILSTDRERDIVKVEPDDPNRCQSTSTQYGQCMNKAIEGSDFCICHGGAAAINRRNKEAMRNYSLTKWQAKLDQHRDAPNIKSLRDEVAILRMLMQERLEKCSTELDLIYNPAPLVIWL